MPLEAAFGCLERTVVGQAEAIVQHSSQRTPSVDADYRPEYVHLYAHQESATTGVAFLGLADMPAMQT